MHTDEVVDFIHRHVKSIWALQLVLLMHAGRGRTWTAEELNRELRGSVQMISDILTGFQRAGLVHKDEQLCYRWQPPPDIEAIVGKLEILHAAHPLAIINAIYTPVVEPIRTLADAFKIKKD